MGGGKIKDGNPKSENSGHPYIKESAEIENPLDEATVANRDIGNDILDKLKSTIEMIKEMIGEGAEITKKEFTKWGKTFKEIVEGESKSKTKDDIDSKRNKGNGSKDLVDTFTDADEEYGSDYIDTGRHMPRQYGRRLTYGGE